MAGTPPPVPRVGCLGVVVGTLILVAVVVLALVVGVFALGIVLAVVVIGLLALGVDRLLLALSPKRRERRAQRPRIFVWRSGTFGSGQVIDATATDTTAWDDQPGRPELGPDRDEPA